MTALAKILWWALTALVVGIMISVAFKANLGHAQGGKAGSDSRPQRITAQFAGNLCREGRMYLVSDNATGTEYLVVVALSVNGGVAIERIVPE